MVARTYMQNGQQWMNTDPNGSGGISFRDYGGGQMDNALRSGYGSLGGGNPYYPQQNALGGIAPAVQPGQTAYAQPALPGPYSTPSTQPGMQSPQQQMSSAISANPQQAMMNNPGAFGTGGSITQNMPGQTPLTGLIGSEQALMQSLQGATGVLRGGEANAMGRLNSGLGGLDPYLQGGKGAFNQMGALSGAQGQEAFDQAFLNSPVQAFLREQGERGVTRNAAALGGLGGGNVMKELTRFGQGLAGTQLQQQIDNLSGMSGMGLNAGQSMGQLYGQQADINHQTGRDIAQGIAGVGQIMGQDRMRTGEGLSANIGGTTSALSQLISQQGAGVSDLTGQSANSLASILQGAGTMNANDMQQLSALLANLSTGSASTAAGVPGIPGTQQTPGMLGDIGNLAGGVGSGLQGWDAYKNG